VKFLYWLFIGIAAAVFVDFAVWNLDRVTFTLWPIGEFSTRLYLMVLLSLLVGFLLGLVVGWIFSWRARLKARERARRIDALERDLAAAEQRARQATPLAIPRS